MRLRKRYNVHAVLAVHAAKLRERQQAAVAELAAERETSARLKAERQRARDAEWAAQCRGDSGNRPGPASLLNWPKGRAV